MDIFKALKLLDEGVKIRDIKMPSGVYLEKVNGKIISSQGRQGVDLNTDAEYEIYEEPKPKYIDEICILFKDLLLRSSGAWELIDCKSEIFNTGYAPDIENYYTIKNIKTNEIKILDEWKYRKFKSNNIII